MRLHNLIALTALAILCGCASPQVRFTRSECIPVVGDEQTDAVRFVSNFQTNEAVPDQQLIYQVAIVDSSGRPVPSGTGKYTDKSGNLTAAKGVMVLQSPWSFENINVSIPAPELNAARESGAAYALFQLTTPDGQVVAQDRAPLPPEFAAARAAPPAIAMRARRGEEPAESDEPPPAQRSRRSPPPTDEPEKQAPRVADSRVPGTDESAAARSSSQVPNRRSGTRSRPEAIIRETPPPDNNAVATPRERRPEPQPRRRTDGEAVAADDSQPLADTPAARESRSAATKQKALIPPAREPDSPPEAAPRSREIASPTNSKARRNTLGSDDPKSERAATAAPAVKPADADAGVQDVEATAPQDRSSGTTYEVKGADSLRSIALEQYGDAQYWPMILRANPEVNPLKLKVGDKLYLPPLQEIQSGHSPTAPRKSTGDQKTQPPPPPAASVYVTKDGDTLPYISKQLYGDSRRWREIYDLNRDQLDTPSAIRRGMRLKLPETPAKSTERDRR